MQVTVNDPTVQQTLAYVGNLAPGATGNVDVMLTGIKYSENETAKIPVVISYEDETGVVSTESKLVDLTVQQALVEDFGGPVEETPEEKKGLTLKGWQIALIGVGVLLILAGIIAGIKALANKKKRREEDELASNVEEIVKAADSAPENIRFGLDNELNGNAQTAPENSGPEGKA